MTGQVALHADPLGLLVAFGAGMLSFLSPCVLPLVPAYLSMVSGLSAAELSALAADPTPVPAPSAHPVAVGSGTAVPATVTTGDDVPAQASGSDPEVLRRHRARLLRGIL